MTRDRPLYQNCTRSLRPSRIRGVPSVLDLVIHKISLLGAAWVHIPARGEEGRLQSTVQPRGSDCRSPRHCAGEDRTCRSLERRSTSCRQHSSPRRMRRQRTARIPALASRSQRTTSSWLIRPRWRSIFYKYRTTLCTSCRLFGPVGG